MITLAECPVGLFLTQAGNLGVKTQYESNDGRIHAYIVRTGEMFWGRGPSTAENHRAQLVTPVDLQAYIDPRKKTPAPGKVRRDRMDAAFLHFMELVAHNSWVEASGGGERVPPLQINEAAKACIEAAKEST